MFSFISSYVTRKIYLSACLILVFSIITACREEKVDSAYTPGTQENLCLNLANTASERKYGMPADQSATSLSNTTIVWVGSSDFKFKKDALFTLERNYVAKLGRNEKGEIKTKYIQGLRAVGRFNIEDLANKYPTVFSSFPQNPSVFYVDLICSPIKSPVYYNPIDENAIGSLNSKLGLIDYAYPNGVISTPVDKRITNQKGFPITINCNYAYKTCDANFFMQPEVLIKYSYPLSQRQNWLRIQEFLVSTLTHAKE